MRASLFMVALWATLTPCHADPLSDSVTWSINRGRALWNNSFSERRWELVNIRAKYDRDDSAPFQLSLVNNGPDHMEEVTAIATVREKLGNYTYFNDGGTYAAGGSYTLFFRLRPGESKAPLESLGLDARGKPLLGNLKAPPLDVAACIGAFNGYLKKRYYMLVLLKLNPTVDPNIYELKDGEHSQTIVASADDKRCIR